MKQEWKAPEFEELNIKETANGPKPVYVADGPVWWDDKGNAQLPIGGKLSK